MGWLMCAFGYHDWARGSHWRRFCVRCGHGLEQPPARPTDRRARRNNVAPEAAEGL